MQTKIRPVIIATAAISLIASCGNSDRDYAKSVCGYRTYDMNEPCLQNKFIGKGNNAGLLKYLKSARFVRMANLSDDQRSIFIREDDTEKGPGEAIVFVEYLDGEIANIRLHKWHGSWYSDPKTGDLIKQKSRLRSCLEKNEKCEHLIRG